MPPQPLSRERVLEAASTLIEREGLDGLSMRKLAAALGVEAMSLYNHVGGKGEVLDGIMETFLARIEVPAASGDWRADLRALAAALRSTARRYPQAASLALTREAISQPGLAVTSSVLEALRLAGFQSSAAVDAQRAMSALLLGTLLRELRAPRSGPREGEELIAEREAALRASDLAPIRDAAAPLARLDFDREYEYGIDFILDALESRRKLPSETQRK